MVLRLYVASATPNKSIKGKQQKIKMVLDSKKIEYEEIDIAADHDKLEEMRKIAGNDKQLAPYLTCGDKKCGDYEEFELAVDDEKLTEFLEGKQ